MPQSSDLLECFAECLSDGLFIIGVDNRLTYVNAALCEILGYDQAELTGKPLNHLLPDRVRASHDEKIAAFRTGVVDVKAMENWRSIRALHKEGGEIPVVIRVKAYGPGMNNIMGILRDMSQASAMEQELVASNQHLKAALMDAEESRIAQVRLIESFSQIFRTPISTVIGFADELRQSGKLHPDHADYVSTIRESGEVLLDKLNRILEAARVHSGRYEPRIERIDVTEAVSTAIRDVEDEFENAEIRLLRPSTPLPAIVTDRSAIAKIVRNLARNAVQHNTGDRPPQIALDMADEEGAVVRISIRDFGPGLPSNVLKYIQDRDLTHLALKGENPRIAQVQRLGVGLMMVRKLCDILSCRLCIESTADGVCAVVDVPDLEKQFDDRQAALKQTVG
ncbi:PAS domain-containing sensor histidine kinase [Fodinicurvata sp. EGI_FJ10296]|uniref:PAS domain-containing sensor histidine kinase n=1 Tax=Fodinicurvata sp. EGI_FJ10296 TaxID=3231908 RepID=UPI003451F529